MQRVCIGDVVWQVMAGEIDCQRNGGDKTREEWVVSMWRNNIDLGKWLEVEFRG